MYTWKKVLLAIPCRGVRGQMYRVLGLPRSCILQSNVGIPLVFFERDTPDTIQSGSVGSTSGYQNRRRGNTTGNDNHPRDLHKDIPWNYRAYKGHADSENTRFVTPPLVPNTYIDYMEPQQASDKNTLFENIHDTRVEGSMRMHKCVHEEQQRIHTVYTPLYSDTTIFLNTARLEKSQKKDKFGN